MKRLYQTLLLLLSFFPVFCQKTASPLRPNIIHIIADDVGYDDLSCFGSKDIRTPNLDRMAAEGMRFTNFYAPHGTCTPSRAAILTGRYAPRMNDNKGLPVLFPDSKEGLEPAKELTITRLLQQQGYTTALFGKWHLGHLPQYLPAAHGFDYFLGIPYPNDHGPERLGNTGSKGFPPIPLLENLNKRQDCDNNDLAELPALFQREACKYIQQQAKSGRPFYLQFANIETHTPWFVPKGFEGRSAAGPFGDAVEYLDGTVGAILNTVKQAGIEESTLIVFSSDNGPLIVPYPELEACYGRYAAVDTTRHHLLRGGKYQSRHDGGTRVACIMKWPGKIAAGSTCHETTAGFDLFNTFAELAGANIPTDRPMDGKSLLPLMFGEAGATGHEVFYGLEARGLMMSVRWKNWKLCLPTDAVYGVGALSKPMLFDLNKDVGEKTDLAVQHPDIVERMTRMADEMAEHFKR